MAISSSESSSTLAERGLTPVIPGGPTRLSFAQEEIDLFSRASHDRNPLHCSERYARKTPFGEPVVFGALGVLAVLGRLADRTNQVIERLSVDFLDALRLGADYQIEIDEGTSDATCKLHDGRRTLLRIDVRFKPGLASAGTCRDVPAPGGDAADRGPAELQPGLIISGTYVPAQDALAELMSRYRLPAKGLGSAEVTAICLASYLIGMELPGRKALFCRMVVDGHGRGELPVDYEAKILSYDRRVDLLRTQVRLYSAGQGFATLGLDAFVRTDVPPLAAFPRSNLWAGKVALIIGASRGLGAALAQGLAWQGCTVYSNYFRSRDEAEAVVRAVDGAAGEIIPIEGDAADVQSCERMRQVLVDDGRSIDLLICNACPPLRTMWIDSQSAERIGRYVFDSVQLVCTPMSVFLPMLASRGGQMTLVSSAWVNTRPADWPHYISAKCAVEGLVQVAANEYSRVRFLIARPPKLLTDLTNTPLGRQRTLPADQAAQVIVNRLHDQPSGALAVLEDFAGRAEPGDARWRDDFLRRPVSVDPDAVVSEGEGHA